MAFYYFNNNTDEHNNHEVHVSECNELKKARSITPIGSYSSCQDAIMAVKRQTNKTNFDGCWHCCRPCHTG